MQSIFGEIILGAYEKATIYELLFTGVVPRFFMRILHAKLETVCVKRPVLVFCEHPLS